MDAKYNWIIDNTGIRMALNVAVFAKWRAARADLPSLLFPVRDAAAGKTIQSEQAELPPVRF